MEKKTTKILIIISAIILAGGLITGTYRLEYDANKDILYYSFRINEYSEVCINAKTGDFTEQHFWDGVYVD